VFCVHLVRPEGCVHLVGESPTRAMVGWPGSWQAVWLGNRLDRSPATNAADGQWSETTGRNVSEA
jgi:hypothetical protein